MHRSPLKRRVVRASPPYCGHRNANANRQNADGRGLERSTVLHFGEFQNATHKTQWEHNNQNAPSFKTHNTIKTATRNSKRKTQLGYVLGPKRFQNLNLKEDFVRNFISKICQNDFCIDFCKEKRTFPKKCRVQKKHCFHLKSSRCAGPRNLKKTM